MAPAALSLTEMVDLAIGSPEVGAVNFSMLHGLLHAILLEIGIGKVKAEVSPEALAGTPREVEPSKRRKKKSLDSASSGKDSKLDDEGEAGLDDESDARATGRDGSRSRRQNGDAVNQAPIPLTYMPYHKLADKLNQLEKKFEDLEALPTNSDLIERGKGGEKEKSRVMSDMWQGMQMSRKVDANTEGISKLMSLTEDLMNSLQKLKDENEALRKELDSKQNADELDALKARIAELEKYRKDCEDRLSAIEDQLPDKELLDGFVTWTALEDALKGLRQVMEAQQPPEAKPQPVEREVTAESEKLSDDDDRPKTTESLRGEGKVRSSGGSRHGETPLPPLYTPVDRDISDLKPTPTPKSTQKSSRNSSPGPSAELQDLLEKLGKLTQRHDALEERVDKLEDELSKKLSKEDFEKLGLNDVLRRIEQLRADIEAQKNSQDSETIKRMENALDDLRKEITKLNDVTDRLSEESRENVKNVQKALESCERLWEKKADKDFVENELAQKADKEAINGKVDRNEFNSTLEELYRLINELKEKLAENEAEWKKSAEHLNTDMENKVERLELEALRDDLLKQLKALAKRVAALKAASAVDDDAAGIRKQLRFHCISCDKKVDMTPQKPVPSLPGGYALPENRSMRPYLVYELDQIRQYARGNQPGYLASSTDPYATNRQCGGTHTVTYPHKRGAKNGYPQYQAFDDNYYRSAPAKIREEDLENGLENGQPSRSRSATRLPNVYETTNKTPQRLTPLTTTRSPGSASQRSRPTSSIVASRRDQGSANGAIDDSMEISGRKSAPLDVDRIERAKTMSDIEVRSSSVLDEVLKEREGSVKSETEREGSVTGGENNQPMDELTVTSRSKGSAKSRTSDGAKSREDGGSAKSRGSGSALSLAEVRSAKSPASEEMMGKDGDEDEEISAYAEVTVIRQPATPDLAPNKLEEDPIDA